MIVLFIKNTEVSEINKHFLSFSEIFFYMAKSAIIEDRTEKFIKHFNELKTNGIIADNKEVADLLGYKSTSAISEILGRRQNIQPDHWELFKKKYGLTSDNSEVEFLRQELLNEREARRATEERERKALEEDKAFFKEIMRSSLNVILLNIQSIASRQMGAGGVMLETLEELAKKPHGSLLKEADNRIGQIEQEAHIHGNMAAQSK